MLGHRRERSAVGELRALEAANLGLGHAHADQGILSGSFGAAPPARIARDVEHRRKGHGEPVGGGLLRRLARGQLPNLRVERRRLAERNGEQRAIPVNHVESDQQRDAEPRLLHGQSAASRARAR